MSIEFENPLTAGTVLVREQIQSQNYAEGSAGWVIKANGDAEFNDVVIRGGTVVSGLALYYDGTPALGNLIMSISATAGTDEFGNAYLAGIGVYGDENQITVLAASGAFAQLRASAPSGIADESAPGLVLALDPSEGDLEPGSVTVFDDTFTHGIYLRTPSPVADPDGVEGDDYAAIRMTGRYGTDPSIQLVAGSTSTPDGFVSINGAIMDGNSRFLSYGEPETYTPTFGGTGGATYSNRTGWWYRFGPMIFFSGYAVVSGAGSGGSNVTVTAPVSVDRTTRQRVGASIEGATAGNNGSCSALWFTTGSGDASDRLRNSTGGNITGADLQAGTIIAVEGWIREAL